MTVLVLTGDGINCENETKRAFELAGANAEIIHINDLLEKPKLLKKYNGLAIPGGFSFGDDISSGQILSLKIAHGLKEEFNEFLDDKKPIIGICNGFQVLVKLGLLADRSIGRSVTLTRNDHGRFMDQWVKLKVDPKTHCIWLNGLSELYLPVRHGEGRLVLHKDKESEIASLIEDHNLACLNYEKNINGSYKEIAGLTDPTGLVLGLMPHPEAAVNWLNHPEHGKNSGEFDGLKIFKNMVNYIS